jgi:hypothetical protein
MSFILNTKVKIPSELETKIKILELAKLHNCEGVVNQLFKNFEYEALCGWLMKKVKLL